MTSDIPRELQEEVDRLIDQIGAFQAAKGRKVARAFKRSRKGRALLEDVMRFNLPLPADFRAMYQNHNGADPGATMSWHEMAVFLDYRWPNLETVIGVNKITRVRKEFPSPDRIWMAREETRFSDLELKPIDAIGDRVPLLATQGPLSAVTYVAFDSPLAMLRTVVAAQDAGILSYDAMGRCIYPLNEMEEIARWLNQRQTYWTALANETVDFQIPPRDIEEIGRNAGNIDPAVAKIMKESLKLK